MPETKELHCPPGLLPPGCLVIIENLTDTDSLRFNRERATIVEWRSLLMRYHVRLDNGGTLNVCESNLTMVDLSVRTSLCTSLRTSPGRDSEEEEALNEEELGEAEVEEGVEEERGEEDIDTEDGDMEVCEERQEDHWQGAGGDDAEIELLMSLDPDAFSFDESALESPLASRGASARGHDPLCHTPVVAAEHRKVSDEDWRTLLHHFRSCPLAEAPLLAQRRRDELAAGEPFATEWSVSGVVVSKSNAFYTSVGKAMIIGVSDLALGRVNQTFFLVGGALEIAAYISVGHVVTILDAVTPKERPDDGGQSALCSLVVKQMWQLRRVGE